MTHLFLASAVQDAALALIYGVCAVLMVIPLLMVLAAVRAGLRQSSARRKAREAAGGER